MKDLLVFRVQNKNGPLIKKIGERLDRGYSDPSGPDILIEVWQFDTKGPAMPKRATQYTLWLRQVIYAPAARLQ
jgi:hypothetical protein